MSKSNAFEADVLRLVLQGVPIANIADNSTAGFASLTLAAHTADPGDGGTQSTNEANYPGYGRSTIPRTPAAWTVSGTSPTVAILSNTVDWPQSLGATPQIITHFSIGAHGGGATKIFYSGALNPVIVVSLGVVPGLQVGTQIQED